MIISQSLLTHYSVFRLLYRGSSHSILMSSTSICIFADWACMHCNQVIVSPFRHQVQHYTGQLAKDTARHLGELSASPSVAENRQWRLQNDRLKDSFTKALNNFQVGTNQKHSFQLFVVVLYTCSVLPISCPCYFNLVLFEGTRWQY